VGQFLDASSRSLVILPGVDEFVCNRSVDDLWKV